MDSASVPLTNSQSYESDVEFGTANHTTGELTQLAFH